MSTKARLNLRYQKHHQSGGDSPCHAPPELLPKPSSGGATQKPTRKRKRIGTVRGWNEDDSGSPLLADGAFHSVPQGNLSPIVPNDTPPIGDTDTPPGMGEDQLVPGEDWQACTESEDLGLYGTTVKKR